MCHVLLEKLPKNPLFLNYPKIAAFSRKVCCTSTDAEIRRPGRDGYLSPPQFKVSDGSPNLDLFPLVSPRCIARFYGVSSGKRTPRFLTRPRGQANIGLLFNTCVIVLIVYNCSETSLLIATFYVARRS